MRFDAVVVQTYMCPFSLSLSLPVSFSFCVSLTQERIDDEMYKTCTADTHGAWSLLFMTGASWSSIEYGGRWKMLHYYASRFFAPVLVSAYNISDDLYVYATSDLTTAFNGTVEFFVFSWNSSTIVYNWQVGHGVVSWWYLVYVVFSLCVYRELCDCLSPCHARLCVFASC